MAANCSPRAQEPQDALKLPGALPYMYSRPKLISPVPQIVSRRVAGYTGARPRRRCIGTFGRFAKHP